MNLDTSLFIKNLIAGTIDYLKEINFELILKHEKKLESVLMSELNKDFELQNPSQNRVKMEPKIHQTLMISGPRETQVVHRVQLNNPIMAKNG